MCLHCEKVKEVTVLPWRGFIQALDVERDLPQKHKEVFGRFYIWKGQDSSMVMGGTRAGRGTSEARASLHSHPQFEASLPTPYRVQAMSPGERAERAEQVGEVRPLLLLSLACPISLQVPALGTSLGCP